MISFVASDWAALNQTDLLSAIRSKLLRDEAFSWVLLLLNDPHHARSFYVMLCTVTFFHPPLLMLIEPLCVQRLTDKKRSTVMDNRWERPIHGLWVWHTVGQISIFKLVVYLDFVIVCTLLGHFLQNFFGSYTASPYVSIDLRSASDFTNQ